MNANPRQCEACKKYYEGTPSFCPNCGAQVAQVAATPAVASSIPVSPLSEQPAVNTPLNRHVLIGGIGAAVLILAVTTFIALRSKKSDSQNQQPSYSREEAIAVTRCKLYAEAQEIYRRTDWDSDGLLEYALSLGGEYGLAGKPEILESDFADAEGIAGKAKPKDGYCYKVLTGQGAAATGGARNFIVNGNMTLGYGLIAFPATYNAVTKRTFTISSVGTIYESDFGIKTHSIVQGMSEFNPEEKTWAVADEDAADRLASLPPLSPPLVKTPAAPTNSTVNYDNLSVKELAFHVDQNLMPGQGEVQEAIWENAYRDILLGKQSSALHTLESAFDPSNRSLLDVCSGECKIAMDVLHKKMGGRRVRESKEKVVVPSTATPSAKKPEENVPIAKTQVPELKQPTRTVLYFLRMQAVAEDNWIKAAKSYGEPDSSLTFRSIKLRAEGAGWATVDRIIFQASFEIVRKYTIWKQICQQLDERVENTDEAVSGLSEALSNDEMIVREAAALLISRLIAIKDEEGKRVANQCAKGIIKYLSDATIKNEPVHALTAMGSIQKIEPIADAVPALLAAMKLSDKRASVVAAYTLGKMGAAAKDAIPALETLARDGNDNEKEQANTALNLIKGEEPEKPIIKNEKPVGEVVPGDLTLVKTVKDGAILNVRTTRGNIIRGEYLIARPTFLILIVNGKKFNCPLEDVSEITADGKLVYRAIEKAASTNAADPFTPKATTKSEAELKPGDISLVGELKAGDKLSVTMKRGNTVDCEYATTRDTYLLILKYQGKNLNCFLKDVQEIKADNKTIFTARADGVMTTGIAKPASEPTAKSTASAKALLNLATQYLKARDLDKAKEYAKKVKEQYPATPEAKEAEIILQQ